MLLSLQKNIVYGPVSSRRLGCSLGINLLPIRVKTCNFNCLYCQYGWTDLKRMENPDFKTFPSIDTVLEAVERALRALQPPPAYLTFSGNGEATLHPAFPEIVEGINRLRDRYMPSTKTAILSNSTRVTDPVIRKALCRLDQCIMKLDAGNEATFRRYNGPLAGIHLQDVVDGLKKMSAVIIQSLFTGGIDGNSLPGDIDTWLEAVLAISPSAVQIYSLDRQAPSSLILPLELSTLAEIQKNLETNGVPSEMF